MDDQSGAPRPSWLSGPALVVDGIRALKAPAVPGIGRQRETQLCRRRAIRRPRRIARGQTRIQVAWPFARQRPPRDIQQEALAEPVVAGDQIQPALEVQHHSRRWTDILQFKPFKHWLPCRFGVILSGVYSCSHSDWKFRIAASYRTCGLVHSPSAAWARQSTGKTLVPSGTLGYHFQMFQAFVNSN